MTLRRASALLSMLATLALPLAAQTAGAGGDAHGRPAQLPSVALPPELDRVLRDYERAWRAGDAAALAALFSEDGFVLQGGRPPMRGRGAIRATYAGQGGGPLQLRALAYGVGEGIGYIIGAYGYGDATAGAVADIGKFTLTLRRGTDGRWLIFSDMDSASQAPRRQGAAHPVPGGGVPTP